jgi:hypothetical protein
VGRNLDLRWSNEITGDCRELRVHNEEFHDLYSSTDQMGRTHMTHDRELHRKALVGKREGKRPPGRIRSRWEDIKTAWDGVVWTRGASGPSV